VVSGECVVVRRSLLCSIRTSTLETSALAYDFATLTTLSNKDMCTTWTALLPAPTRLTGPFNFLDLKSFTRPAFTLTRPAFVDDAKSPYIGGLQILK